MRAPLTKSAAIAACNVPALIRLLRDELEKGEDNIPVELKNFKGWLVWKVTNINPATGKFNKIPLYPRSHKNRCGTQGSEADMANLGTWDDAIIAFRADRTLAGVGFAPLPSFGIVALDVDYCISDGRLRNEVELLTNNTYCEVSPSGTGIRAFWHGTARNGKNHETGYELFHSTGFVTITGNQRENIYYICGDVLPTLEASMQSELEKLSHSSGGAGKISMLEKLKETLGKDPRLQAIKDAGLYERDMGGGKHSIECPFESEHSDSGRPGGDGDTVYFQPNTNGYKEGWVHCSHTHGNHQGKYWEAIGYDVYAEEFMKIDLEHWPIPHPIADGPPRLPPFDLEMLPDSLRLWIKDIAERMQISPDIPAIGAITALSAVIGRRIQIRPKAYDNWTVVPNLWGLVVAPPGYMKSPALSEVMKPLHQMESEAHGKYEAARIVWEREKARIKLSNRAIEQITVKKYKNGEVVVPELQFEPDEPIATRYCVNNFSLEALGEVLMGNQNGVLAFSDEIYGLLKMSEKPGNEGLQDFLLSAWNGDGAFTFDRIGRGLNRRIENVCVAILGGIQPGRLEKYVSGATQGGAGDSGLMQRFQLITWPDLNKKWERVDREPDVAAREAAYQVFKRVVGGEDFQNIDADNITTNKQVGLRRFDTEAQAAYYAWLEPLELLIRGDTLSPVMSSHLSKFRSLVPSLALIFAVADGVKGSVPLRYVNQAIQWAHYLRQHAERVYACATRTNTRYARALLAKIMEGAVVDGFTPRDVYLKCWSLLDVEGVAKATDLLCELDYLMRVEKRPQQGGRPSITYRINPNIKNQK
uniref:DUF3987 domain-containing protein n=1 Tax=Candidatus Nitrotoga fabula TaxID=2182327 RepID=A0A2X0R975_9PROT|nr:protein of unknown function [Candidatus Nitrotoga fabula]